MMRIKKNDTVVVMTGKDKGRTGTVLDIDYKSSRVKVGGVAIVTFHRKPRRQGEQGAIVKEEGYIHISNVMPLCPTTNKPCRVGFKTVEGGKKVRISRASGEPL